MNKESYTDTNDPIYILFYGEKTSENGWFEIDKGKNKIWNQLKVEEFWKTLREQKTKNDDFDFSHFIFPKFDAKNFWGAWEQGKNNNRIFNNANFNGATFKEKASFLGATFEGEASFDGATFERKASFIGVSFERKASFYEATFKGEAFFSDATFKEKASFDRATFEGEAPFDGATFKGEADFWKATFEGEASFYWTTFKGGAYFSEATFEGEASFGRATYKSELFFRDIYCTKESSLRFNNTKFSEDDATFFQNWHIDTHAYNKKTFSISFEECIFTNKVTFLDCDFSFTQFIKCDLVEARFSNCAFPPKTNRDQGLKMINEQPAKDVLTNIKIKKINEANGFARFQEMKERSKLIEAKVKALIDQRDDDPLKIEHYNMMAETYRQLKTNLMGDNNWAEAGDAYHSEMRMRKASIKLQRKRSRGGEKFRLFFTILVMNVHGWFSGYQQSFSRPLLWLLAVLLLFSAGFYGFHQQIPCENTWSLQCLSEKYTHQFNLRAAYKGVSDSLYAAFPFSGKLPDNLLKIPMLLERLMSSILIAFFVIATRARLKQ